jgi:hypothetical protein
MQATRNILKPRLPLLQRVELERDSLRHIVNIPNGSMLTDLGIGFPNVEPMLFDPMMRVISELCRYTIQVESYIRGTLSEVNLNQFADDRNGVQHCLISLPTAEEAFAVINLFHYIYDPCRLALMIYSAAVVFVTPTYIGTHYKLAMALRKTLDGTEMETFWHEEPDLLLWILVLGGMAALGCVERDSFVSDLAYGRRLLDIKSWDDLKDRLQTFLWLESACDPPGKDLWFEVGLLGTY